MNTIIQSVFRCGRISINDLFPLHSLPCVSVTDRLEMDGSLPRQQQKSIHVLPREG